MIIETTAKKSNRIILTLLLYFSYCISISALKYKIIITDGHSIVPKASVILSDSIGNVLNYTYSDYNGILIIDSIPTNSTSLTVRAMGYELRTISIKDIRNDTIELRPKSTILQEVTVKANRGYQKGDTINYFVNAFSKEFDHSISDVLKRMPGIDIQENGQILFNGKAISELKVENMNLTGNQYVQISENLKATNVARVQILQNNQPIKMLRDINFSDDIAINLVLKEDFKSIWQFGIETGVGLKAQTDTEFLCDSKIMALIFGKRYQSLSFYKYNNTGNDISKEVQAASLTKIALNNQSHIISPASFFSPDINNQRHRFNNTHTAATNWLIPLKGNAEFRINLNGYINQESQSLNRYTKYLTLSGLPEINEESHYSTHNNNLNCELTYKLNSDTKYIENKTNIEYSKSKISSIFTLNNDNQSTELFKLPTYNISNDFHMLWKSNNSDIFNVDFTLYYQTLPGFFNAYNHLNQETHQRFFDALLTAGFSHKIGNFNVSIKPELHIERHNISITSNESISSTSYNCIYTDPILFSNEIPNEYNTYNLISTSIIPKIEYTSSKFKIWANCKLLYQYYKLNRKGNNSTTSNNYFKPLPNLGLYYSPNNKLRFGINYNYSWRPASNRDLIIGPYFINASSARENTEDFYTTTLNSLYSYFNYTDALSGWNASLNYSFSYIKGIPLTYTTLIDNICLISRIPRYNNSSTQFISTRFGKLCDFLDLNFSLKSEFFQSKSNIIVMESISNQSTYGINLKGQLSFNPIPWIEIIYHPSYSITWNNIKTHNSLTISDYTWRNQLSVFINMNKFNISFKNEWINPQSDNLPNCFFSDIYAEFKQKKFYIGINLTNIFGTKEYKQFFLDATQTRILSTPLRGREIILKFSIDL